MWLQFLYCFVGIASIQLTHSASGSNSGEKHEVKAKIERNIMIGVADWCMLLVDLDYDNLCQIETIPF